MLTLLSCHCSILLVYKDADKFHAKGQRAGFQRLSSTRDKLAVPARSSGGSGPASTARNATSSSSFVRTPISTVETWGNERQKRSAISVISCHEISSAFMTLTTCVLSSAISAGSHRAIGDSTPFNKADRHIIAIPAAFA